MNTAFILQFFLFASVSHVRLKHLIAQFFNNLVHLKAHNNKIMRARYIQQNITKQTNEWVIIKNRACHLRIMKLKKVFIEVFKYWAIRVVTSVDIVIDVHLISICCNSPYSLYWNASSHTKLEWNLMQFIHITTV